MFAPYLRERIRPIAFIFVCTLVLDQVTKVIARQLLSDNGVHEYLGGTVLFAYAENTGAFLSVGARLGEQFRFLIFIVGVAFVLIWAATLLMRRKDLDIYEIVGLSLLFSGGFGNLIDRIFRGYVVDFVQVGIGPVRTGIFNIADMAILGGVGLLLFHSYFVKKKPEQKPSP